MVNLRHPSLWGSALATLATVLMAVGAGSVGADSPASAPGSLAVEEALAHLGVMIRVWSYDPRTGGFHLYDPGAPEEISDLKYFEVGRGYWVYSPVMLGPVQLGAFKYNPVPGWNLIGWRGTEEYSLTTTAIRIEEFLFFDSLDRAWAYSEASKSFILYDSYAPPGLSDLHSFEPGHGYWVRFNGVWDLIGW